MKNIEKNHASTTKESSARRAAVKYLKDYKPKAAAASAAGGDGN
jgi:hypothetical protein